MVGPLTSDSWRNQLEQWVRQVMEAEGISYARVLAMDFFEFRQRLSTVKRTADAPREYLTSWREILIALGMKDNAEDQGKVKRLSKRFSEGCPITIPKQGAQPKADKAKLLEWWNGLEQKFEESRRRERDRRATVAGQHPYGRDGIVAPDISGEVKKRRKDRKP